MCGINGIFGLENMPEPEVIIEKMNKSLVHRGPNSDGVYLDDDIVLGHRRLSIIDLSENANQPFYSYDKRYVIVYNGELYNYNELKSKISDYPFKTTSDTEVVLVAFMKWGKACVHAFNGMFAMAIWDNYKKQLFLCRDRLGIKPLYYSRIGQQVVFSSELRSILAADLVPRRTNHYLLTDYCRYQTVHAPNTIIENVNVLMPGYWAIISDNEFTVEQYWDINQRFQKSEQQSAEQIKKNIYDKLVTAVDLRTSADVPLGAFLSGGIDSSIITGIMSREKDVKVDTFSVIFDESEYSEAQYARIISKKFNTNHHEIKLSAQDFLNNLPDALLAMDHPGGDGPNSYIVSKATKAAGITVALSGLGGDELFAGYPVFKHTFQLERNKWILSFPNILRRIAGNTLVMARPTAASEKIRETLKELIWDLENTYQYSRQVLTDKTIFTILNKLPLPTSRVFEIVQNGVGYGTPGFKAPLLSKVSYAEINTYMQNTLLRDSDQMSMAHALEVRVPFLDHELVEYVCGVRDSIKFPYSPKKLLVDSIGDLLPKEIWNRPKMGFSFPWDSWLRNELKAMSEKAIHNLAQRNSFDGTAVIQLWNRFIKGDKRIGWARIWMLVVLENWLYNNNIEG